jgi:hypothetical protein
MNRSSDLTGFMRRSTFIAGSGITKVGRFRSIRGGDGRFSQISPTRPLCQAQQRSPKHEQVDQRAGHIQALRILGEAAVTHLAEAEDHLQHQERMLDLGPHPRLAPVLAPLDRIEPATHGDSGGGSCPALAARARESPRACPDTPSRPTRPSRCRAAASGSKWESCTLAAVAATEWISFSPAVDTDVRLHAEVPLVALLGLVHLRIALAVAVLGRARRADDRRIHDRARCQP